MTLYIGTYWKHKKGNSFIRIDSGKGGVAFGVEVLPHWGDNLVFTNFSIYLTDLRADYYKIDCDVLLDNRVFELLSPDEIVKWKMKNT